MKLSNIREKLTWQRGYALAAWSLFALVILRVILPQRGTDLYETYGLCIIFAMAAIYFYEKGISGPIEIKLFILYLAWVLITRYINRDFYLFQDYDFVVISLFCFLFFSAGTVLEGRDRERLLDAISIIFIPLFAIGSLAGIFIAITNTYIHIPPENVWITIISLSELDRLNLFSYTALGTPIRLFLVWSLAIYQFAKRKNIFLRTVLSITILILHIAIAMSKARTTHISMAVAFAILCMLLTMYFLGKKLGKLNLVVLPIVALASLLLCYKSFDYSNIMISKLNSSFAPRFEEYYESRENKLDPEYFGVVISSTKASTPTASSTSEPKASALKSASTPELKTSALKSNDSLKMVDSRDVSSNKTLSGRTYIWEAGLTVVKENPKIALFGCVEQHMMDKVNEANTHTTRKYTMMHNFLMEAMVGLGIPGFLILLCWTLIIVKDMVLMFFSKNAKDSIEKKLLILPIAGMFLINMCEISIFGQIDLSGIVFFMIAGVFTSYYYDSHKRKFI